MKKGSCFYRASLAAAIAFLLTTIAVNAASITVVSTADAGGTCPGPGCTLRQAIAAAGSGDTIDFSLPPNAIIKLTNAKLLLTKNVTITGPGANLLTVQRDSNAGTQLRIFEVNTGITALISGLTISNGNDLIGSGIYNAGVLTVLNCTVSGNFALPTGSMGEGAGITNIGTLTVMNSTISGNTSEGLTGIGGGFSNSGTLTLQNSTVSGNNANFQGAGIYNSGKVTITNSTITANTITSHISGIAGGGIYHSNGIPGSAASIRNTIVARNTSDKGPDIFGPVTSQGYNLIGNNKDASIAANTGDQIGTSAAPIDPSLGPLQDNGGPTPTHALLAVSKAIDKGDSGGSSTDQRGFNRPVDTPSIPNTGDGADIGAFEVQADQLAGCSEINLVVNTNAEAGSGSLRSIITAACPGSTITFAANVRGTITLTSGELTLNKNLTIRGPGAKLLTIQRSTANGTAPFRIFHINGNFADTISGLTISNGFLVSGLGGGISNDNGYLTLDGVTISGNIADIGAGVYTGRAATITNSTISGNIVSGSIPGDGGGAVYNQGGTLNVTNCTFSGNFAQNSSNQAQGGGIRNNVGTTSISNSTIAGNSADQGGGIYNSGGVVTFQSSIIAQNTSPTGPDLNGPFTSNGFNLIGNATLGSISSIKTSDQIGNAPSPINPLLGSLQDNGGPTFTRALLINSPAIDKGIASGLSTDQRGLRRPSDITGIANGAGSDGSDIGAFELQAPTLANISTRLRVETGDNVLFGGFIVTGNHPKKVIILGIGPSLTNRGVPGALANPTLELYFGNTLLKSNDDWINSPDKQAIIDSGVAPTDNLESAIIATLPANSSGYSAIVRGAGGSTGVGALQAYDLDRSVDSKLANISTRGLVQTGDNLLIAGTIVLGETAQKVIVRAIGPSLGLPGQLADPILELRDQNGGLIDSNDNWKDSPNKQAIIDSTIPPSNDLESAIVAILPANGASYTALVRGANNSTGIGVVEVYGLN